MDKLNSIFNLKEISSTEDTHIVFVELNESHEVFKGHFPNQPVLPGVVQLQLVKMSLEQILGRNITTNVIKSVKYLQVIDPRKITSISLEIKVKSNNEDDISIQATLHDGDSALMKLSASYS